MSSHIFFSSKGIIIPSTSDHFNEKQKCITHPVANYHVEEPRGCICWITYAFLNDTSECSCFENLPIHWHGKLSTIYVPFHCFFKPVFTVLSTDVPFVPLKFIGQELTIALFSLCILGYHFPNIRPKDSTEQREKHHLKYLFYFSVFPVFSFILTNW